MCISDSVHKRTMYAHMYKLRNKLQTMIIIQSYSSRPLGVRAPTDLRSALHGATAPKSSSSTSLAYI
jgi:hypothetical protein